MTVDGRNPVPPVDMENLLVPLLTGFYMDPRWLGMGFLNHQRGVGSGDTRGAPRSSK